MPDTQVITGPASGTQALQDYETLLATLEADDQVPDSIRAVDAGNKDQQGAASHAFAEKTRKNKEAAALIRKQQDELTAMRKVDEDRKKQDDATREQQARGGNAAPVNRTAILQALTVQAMQNLGMFQIVSPEDQRLLDLEVQRLYSDQVSTYQRQIAAAQTAPAIINSKLEAFVGKLGEAGVAEVKRRLGQYPILQQTDDGLIRGIATQYLGELALSGGSTTTDGGEGETATGDAVPVDRNAQSTRTAAASSVRNGNPGFTVQPGDRQKKPGPKPATAEEAVEMRKLKMTDLVAYRAAKVSKANYIGR